MILLPREALIKTGPLDYVTESYRPLAGWLLRRRFNLASRLIQNQSFSRLLEVGYGSGIFLPELAAHCTELYGIDAHECAAPVTAVVEKHGIRAELCRGTVESLPFEQDYFDCVVCVTTLEFVADVDLACREIDRVLAPNGRLILVTPGPSGLKAPTGHAPGAQQRSVVPALERWFHVERTQQSIGGLFRAFDCGRNISVRPHVAPAEVDELAFANDSTAEQPELHHTAPVFPINGAPRFRSTPAPARQAPPADNDPLIGDLNCSSKEELERAILAVRRRKHQASARPIERERQETA